MNRYLLIVYLLAPMMAVAQPDKTAEQVLRDIQDAYANMKESHVIMNTDNYESSEASHPFNSERMEVWFDEYQSYTMSSSFELLSNKVYFISINHGAQLIQYVSKAAMPVEAVNPMSGFQLIDSLMKTSNPEIISRGAEYIHIRLKSPNEFIKHTDAFINSSTFLTMEMDIFFNTNRMESEYVSKIYFEYEGINALEKETQFDEARYLSIHKGVVSPSEKYQSYKVQEVKSINLN